LKKLEIIIPHENLIVVNDILHKYKVGGMSFYDIKGRGRTKIEPISMGTGQYRYVPEFAAYKKVEAIVPDQVSKPIIDEVLKVLGGSYYSGKLFVYDVAEAYDLSSKETREAAI